MDDEERIKAHAKSLRASLERSMDLLSPIQDPLLAILKAHLLVEESLNGILSASGIEPKFLEEARLSFAQKRSLARGIMNPRTNPRTMPVFWKLTDELNSARNRLVHRLEPGDVAQLLDKLIRVSVTAPALTIMLSEEQLRSFDKKRLGYACLIIVVAMAVTYAESARRQDRHLGSRIAEHLEPTDTAQPSP